MDLKSLLQRVDDIESNAPSFRRSLSESLYRSPEMSKHWKKLDEGFFKGYDQYLKEVALTPDQIQNIFKQAGAQAGGAEAAKDPGKLEKIVDKVMPSNQASNLEKSLPEPDAGPVQGFEQKAQQAVDNIPNADPATKQSLMQWVKNGLKKPESQQLILAALSAGLGGLISKVGPMLSMIPGGGPVVSAVTGALIAGTIAVASAKMQGKDWKSAFKGAIKPALMGGAAAVVGNLAASAVSGAVSAATSGGDDQAKPANDAVSRRGASSGDMAPGDFDNMKQVPTNPDGTPMSVDQVNTAKDAQATGQAAKPVTPSTPSDGSYQQAAPLGADGKPMQQVPMDEPGMEITPKAPQGSAMDPEYLKKVVNGEIPRAMITPEKAQAALDWQAQNGGQQQTAQQPAAGATLPGGLAQYYKNNPGVRENAINKQATLSEWLKQDQKGITLNTVQLNTVFVEGMFDFLKGGKKDAAKAGAGEDSLNKAWKDAGSPTDSEEVAKILQAAGIAPDVVAKIYADAKIPAPSSAAPAQADAASPADAQAAQGQAPAEQPAAADQTAQQPAQQAAQPSAEPPPTPQAEKQSKVGVGQINKVIPTLRVRDLKSVQKNVDATLQKRGQARQPTVEGFYSKFLSQEI
jgi:hypothetical protein